MYSCNFLTVFRMEKLYKTVNMVWKKWKVEYAILTKFAMTAHKLYVLANCFTEQRGTRKNVPESLNSVGVCFEWQECTTKSTYSLPMALSMTIHLTIGSGGTLNVWRLLSSVEAVISKMGFTLWASALSSLAESASVLHDLLSLLVLHDATNTFYLVFNGTFE